MVGERIKQARLMLGLSQRELARRVGLSATAISKFEQGTLTPSSATLLRLARALGRPLEFFVRPVSVTHIEPAYRKRSRVAKKAEKALLASIAEWLERYLELETILFGSPKAFTFPKGFPRQVESFDDVEEAALQLRKVWDLGIDPIDNFVQLLEDKNVKVGIFDVEQGFDACAFTADEGGHVLVMVIRKGLPGDRTRFNLGHELGHLLLKVRGGLAPEKAASRFAGAFLVPKPVVIAELGQSRRILDLRELEVLKHKYGLSMQAWIYRARDLGIISEAAFRRLNKAFRERGWHRVEPGTPYPPEEPVRFQRLVFQALAEGLVSVKRAAELLACPPEAFQGELASLDEGLAVELRHR